MAQSHRARPAFTLLEVILALAILAGSVAMIGELISYASQSASDAEAETRAQLLACTLMDEMVSGRTKPEARSREPAATDDTVPWVYTVSVGRTEIEGLTSVEVVVEQDLEKKFRPVHYRLVRWLPTRSATSEKEDSAQEPTDGEGDG